MFWLSMMVKMPSCTGKANCMVIFVFNHTNLLVSYDSYRLNNAIPSATASIKPSLSLICFICINFMIMILCQFWPNIFLMSTLAWYLIMFICSSYDLFSDSAVAVLSVEWTAHLFILRFVFRECSCCAFSRVNCSFVHLTICFQIVQLMCFR